MDLATHLSSCNELVKHFWKEKPILKIQNRDFTFRYSEVVGLVNDSEEITTVMIELTSPEIKNLPILSLASKCFEKLNNGIPLDFVMVSGNRKDRIQLYVVPIKRTEADEANLVKKLEHSKPKRLEQNEQRAVQCYLKKLSEVGGGRGTVPTDSNNISDLETNLGSGNKHILTQPKTEDYMTKTKVQSPKKQEGDRLRDEYFRLKCETKLCQPNVDSTTTKKKVKSSKKQERDRLRAEQFRLKFETKFCISQMWTVPIEAKSVICSCNPISENSDKEC